MKNSLIPSELWDGPTEHEKLYGININDTSLNTMLIVIVLSYRRK